MRRFKPFKTQAHIYSLDGEMREITVLGNEILFGHTLNNSYIVQYGNIKCTAILNPANFQYYADDVYGIVKEN